MTSVIKIVLWNNASWEPFRVELENLDDYNHSSETLHITDVSLGTVVNNNDDCKIDIINLEELEAVLKKRCSPGYTDGRAGMLYVNWWILLTQVQKQYGIFLLKRWWYFSSFNCRFDCAYIVETYKIVYEQSRRPWWGLWSRFRTTNGGHDVYYYGKKTKRSTKNRLELSIDVVNCS